MTLSVIILAAGQGVRMRSSLPKVLHPIGGTSILGRILNTVNQINPKQIVVIHGHQGDQLKKAFVAVNTLTWVAQAEQLGTGHAVLQALPAIDEVEQVLITYGDVPLITFETLKRLLETTKKDEIGFITVDMENPTGFGRILRDKTGQVIRIVEEKETTPEEKKIKEINAGFFVVPSKLLKKWIPNITAQNTQKEYYLPEIIPMAVSEGVAIKTIAPHADWEVTGINNKVQLAELERIFQKEQAIRLMQQGVTLLDPARFDNRGDLTVGKDVVIDINVIIEGKVILGDCVTIGPNVCLKDTVIQDGVHIFANSFIEGATIGEGCNVGPFARLREGTILSKHARIGNFVEIKNSTIGSASKINHLSYVGDASVGREVNIGAGTITCNYDGKKKNKTVIGDHVFIGSDTQLIAPVTIGEGVTVGAGTTVTRDIPANYLVHNRIEHRSVANWSLVVDKELE